MAGINTGPSMMSRLGNMGAGMANGLAQNYGGDLSGAAKATSGLLNRQKSPMRRPGVTSGLGGQMPGQRMPMPQNPMAGRMQAPGLISATTSGPEMQAQMPQSINTGPSPQLFTQPYANLFQPPSGNSGITGGMSNRPSGYERPNMGAPGTDIGGLFGRFNQFAGR